MNDPNDLVMVVTTVETTQDADTLAKALLDESLAACVQVSGQITSHYRWSGKLRQSKEFRVTIKTTFSAWPALKDRLDKMHPYDEPQVVMLKIADTTDGYRDWVVDQTT